MGLVWKVHLVALENNTYHLFTGLRLICSTIKFYLKWQNTATFTFILEEPLKYCLVQPYVLIFCPFSALKCSSFILVSVYSFNNNQRCIHSIFFPYEFCFYNIHFHITVGKGEANFNSSLPLPPTSQRYRH